MAPDELCRLGGQQKGGVAFLDHRFSVSVPVENAVAGVSKRVDEGAVVAVVMVESALQGQMVMLPFPEVPFAHHPGGVAGLAQGFGDGPLVAQHPVL